jgi:EAL and modified HD-GYP domain-containing signal transduction protein
VTQPSQAGFFMARQPIYDRCLNHVAYELLYRKSDTTFGSEITTEDEIISLTNVLMDVGLDRLAGNKRGFFNVPESMLSSDALRLLPPANVTLEVLEDTVWSEQVANHILELKALGYQMALDDYIFEDRHAKFLPLVDLVKVDIMGMAPEFLRSKMQGFRRKGQIWLAEKVETQEEFEFCKSVGFDLYQGYFFAKPQTIRGSGVRANQSMSLSLLAKIQDPDITMDELEKLIIANVALCHKVLRLVNCVANGLPTRVESIKQGLMYLGTSKIRTMASLAVITSIPGKTPELYRMAMIRARICEMAARESGFDSPDKHFTLGMMSVLDALTDMPMSEIIAELPLADEVLNALVGTHDRSQCDQTLTYVQNVEHGDWELAMENLTEVSPEIYAEAVQWAKEQERSLAA